MKGVRIVRLYRVGHGDGRGRMGKRCRMMDVGAVVMGGGGRRGETSEIVGERPPVG